MGNDEHQRNELVVYRSTDGVATSINTAFDGENFWLTQLQIAKLFGVTRQNISLHIKNIYDTAELELSTTCKKNLRVRKNGSTVDVALYNLDVILSVGYRVNSKTATHYRQWANKIIKERLGIGHATGPELSYDQQRVLIRDRISKENSDLMESAKTMGVQNYASFYDAGYKGMYSMAYAELRESKGVGTDALLDRIGPTELAANEFRITQTNDKLQANIKGRKLVGQIAAMSTHHSVGKEVRDAIARIGGKMPEDLPAEPDNIRDVRRRLEPSGNKGQQLIQAQLL
jgi:hypothetical protein